MRVVFSIHEDSTLYSYPTSADDITFKEFVEFLDMSESAPDILKDIDQATEEGDDEKVEELNASIDAKILSMLIYPYFVKVVSHFTGVPYSVLIGEEGPGMNVTQLEGLYYTILRALAPPHFDEYEYEQAIEFEGKTYHVPSRLMEHASVIEFAEAAQFQAAMVEVKSGHYRALIDVCAVLLRLPGEKYSENVYKRNRRNFARLPLAVVWQVAFFLTRQSGKLSRDFQIYTGLQTLGQLKRELKTSREPMAGILH